LDDIHNGVVRTVTRRMLYATIIFLLTSYGHDIFLMLRDTRSRIPPQDASHFKVRLS